MRNKVDYLLNKDPDYKQDSSYSSSSEILSKNVKEEDKNSRMRRTRVEPIEWLQKEDEEHKEMSKYKEYSNIIGKTRTNNGLMKRLKNYKILSNNSFEWGNEENP